MNVKALVGAFNQEKALVGAFSVIVQPVVEPMEHYTALVQNSYREYYQWVHWLPVGIKTSWIFSIHDIFEEEVGKET